MTPDFSYFLVNLEFPGWNRLAEIGLRNKCYLIFWIIAEEEKTWFFSGSLRSKTKLHFLHHWQADEIPRKLCPCICSLYVCECVYAVYNWHRCCEKKNVTVTLHPMDIVSVQVSRIFWSKYIAKYDVDNLLDNFPEN